MAAGLSVGAAEHGRRHRLLAPTAERHTGVGAHSLCHRLRCGSVVFDSIHSQRTNLQQLLSSRVLVNVPVR